MLPILTGLLSQLKPGLVAGHSTVYTACCLAYLGLLHSGEFTVGKGGKYSCSLNLSQQSIQFFPDFENAMHARLTLPASKTDPFQKGVSITIAAAPGQPTCPIATLKALFVKQPHDGNAPLFKQPDGTALSYSYFIDMIRDALFAAGFNPSLYAGHSFCGGTASAAAAVGYSDYKIQLLGRWRSDSYKLYIENDPSRILHLSSLLHMASNHLASNLWLSGTTLPWLEFSAPSLSLRTGLRGSRTFLGLEKYHFFSQNTRRTFH
ncbi:hypothetical protein H2248_012574 [Termitomyces sp. 'cryptogamus']|nr:hypothetical protein H2248_012574 [Termitomyces sp. 'cryptogamus']